MSMEPTAQDIQSRLKNLGLYGGKIDGDLGPASRQAIWAALDALAKAGGASVGVLPPTATATAAEGIPGDKPIGLLPFEWMQNATIHRIHLHWTAGSHKASNLDKNHYHVLVEGDGKVVKGNCDISANSTTSPKGKKAHHTLNANTGALAVSMCAMLDAKQSPFDPGKFPLTKEQWDKASIVVAELCRRYKVSVNARTVLTHAEVQVNLGIRQRGKWDIAKLPFDPAYDTAKECGDRFRREVQAHLNRLI